MSKDNPAKWKKGQSGNPAGRPKGTTKLAKLMEGKNITQQMEEAFKKTGGIKRLIQFANKGDREYLKFLELFIKVQQTKQAEGKDGSQPIVNFHFSKEEVKDVKDIGMKIEHEIQE